MRFVNLFAGIGGLHLGNKRAILKTLEIKKINRDNKKQELRYRSIATSASLRNILKNLSQLSQTEFSFAKLVLGGNFILLLL